jgi:methylenetetrahydrofolate dehydrogenase (NADP+)/methenyltetrahydrofolate cyclohydrolase
MTAKILTTIELSETLREHVASDVGNLKQKHFITPKLVVILIGHHPASTIYVQHKFKACEKIGIICEIKRLEETITTKQLIDAIHKLNFDQSVHGVLIQLPLPEHISIHPIIEAIDPLKDVDGFHPNNIGLLALGTPRLRSCTPFGIIQLLKAYQIPLKGKDVLVIGRSRIVGLPMTLELLAEGATVTCAHRNTENLQDKIKNHEIIIVATGKRNLIEASSFRDFHVIVDVGIHRINGRVCGDVDFDEAQKKVRAITPVPGGVGPRTITALLQNIVRATHLQLD